MNHLRVGGMSDRAKPCDMKTVRTVIEILHERLKRKAATFEEGI